MYRHITVPIDSSPESIRAVPWAADLARKSKCVLELVTVAFPPVVGTELYGRAVLVDRDIEAMRHDAQRRLEELAAVEGGGLPTTVTVLKGPIESTLAEHIRSSEADLIVMSRHDAGRLEHILVGSVSHSVVAHTHVPVFLVPGERTEALSIKHVLIPLDGSPFSEEVVSRAATLARLSGARVTLLTVVQSILAFAVTAGLGENLAGMTPINDTGANLDEVERSARTKLESTSAQLSSAGIRAHVATVINDRPGHAIVDYARTSDIDLIAMSTHGRSGLKRLLAGSVAHQVMDTWGSAMLLYRPGEPSE